MPTSIHCFRPLRAVAGRVVDASDYVLWRKTFGESGLGLMADGSGNGEVDQADYSIWREHFGMTAGSGAGGHTPWDAAVPEPATMALLAGMLAVVAASRYRHA